MKRVVAALLVLMCMVGLFAGVLAEGGVGSDFSIVARMYPYADGDVRYVDDGSGLGIGAGARGLWNSFSQGDEPDALVIPYAIVSYKNLYIAGGASLDTDSDWAAYARLGYQSNMMEHVYADIALELSATPFDVDSDDTIADAFGSAILTVFNIPKLSIGMTYRF